MRNSNYKRGLSLVELLVALSILSVFIVLVADFQSKVFIFNRIFQGGIYVQSDADNVLKSMAAEIRSMSPSSLGAYSIDSASTSTVTFYNDIDDDGLKERIRYFVSGTTLKKGVTKPSGNPLTYNTLNEVPSTLISNVRNDASTAIFTYYDTNYDGVSTTTLPLPINILSIRLIKITVILDNNTNQPLAPITVSTQTSIRNLKDNI